ncbi:LamG domain-containing protein [Nostoc sp. CHAB 5834]|nr:LamG domain-containing protein [Nostoc sp. CHAB 5834]
MSEQNFVLTFDGVNDRVELSKGFPSIEKAITIEFWAKGENSLIQQTSILEAYNAQNARVLNIHLPWKHNVDTRIFWDAGNQNGYDRIEKPVQLSDYNVWTHWAFVKDAVTEQMYIYQNGKVWHQGSGQKRSLAGIQKFVIGSAANATNYWKGSVAEFRIWNQARTQLEIEQQMNRRLVGSERGLVGYLPLDGDVSDRTIASNNGKLYETTWTKAELPVKLETQQQSVLNFDGKDDYISCGKGQSSDKGLRFLNLTQTLTLEAWVNLASYQGGAIFTKQYNPAEPDKPGQPPLDKGAIFYSLLIEESTKLPMFIYSTKDKPNQVFGGTTKTEIALEKWYHLAVVVSNQQVELFVNGQSQGTTKIEGAIADNSDADLLIGKRHVDNSYFTGQLAELRIWNIPRTPAEIQTNMSRRLESIEPGLVGYWLLEKGSGEIAYDSCFSDSFGMIAGATWSKSKLPIAILSRKDKFSYAGKIGDIRALDAFKPLPSEVHPSARWLANFYQSAYGLGGATKDVLVRQVLIENGGDPTKIPAKLPAKQIATAPENLTRLRLDKYSDEFFVERRLNGFNPGQLKRVQNQPWEYVTRYDMGGIQKIDPHGILPKLIEARFCLEGQQLTTHSIEYTLFGETQVQTQRPGDQDWEWAKKLFRCTEFLYHETGIHLGRLHLNIDQYAMAFYRNVINNPIQKLLEPHLEIVLNMNTRGVFAILGYKDKDGKDVDGAVTFLSCVDVDNMYVLIRQELSNMTYRNGNPRSQFLPDYITNNHFDRSASTMWRIITNYVSRFFANNRASIQSYWSEIVGMSEDLSANSILKKELGTLDIKTMQDLQDLCVYVIYNSSFYHSWVNNKQFEDAGDVDYVTMSAWKDTDPLLAARHAKQILSMQNLTAVRCNLVMDVGPAELKDAIWKQRAQIEPGLPLEKLMMSISI